MASWQAIAAIAQVAPTELFAREPDRLARLVVEESGIRCDFAKMHLSAPLIDAFVALAAAQGLAAAREALFTGGIVGADGAPAGEHPAERGSGAPDSVARAKALHARMRGLIDAIEADALGPIAAVLHVGAGGAASGPRLLIDALGREAERHRIEIVSNVDGAALEAAYARLDPATTLVAIASDFADPETMLNAESALAWLEEGGVADPYGQVIALTAEPERALAWGVDETRVLPFAGSVDAPHCVWTSVGFAVALALGWDAFESLLEGAAAMDRHFRLAPPAANAPVLAAFADALYARGPGGTTRALFAYDERLRLLPDHVRQLATGDAPIVWGATGTDIAPAVAARLYRGSLIPVEFVAVVEPGSPLDDAHHRALLGAAFAHGAALLAADRASTTILLDRLDPARLGALLAFYEHRAFVGAVLAGDDPFAPVTVPGGELAEAIAAGVTDGLDVSTRALVERAG